MKTSFFTDVHEVAKLIPQGRVTTYGAIANYLGLKSSARMVGWAMNGCPPDVPAHRVVNRVGLLSGKNNFPLPDQMQELLQSEGIEVQNDQVVHFSKLFWDPAIEIGL